MIQVEELRIGNRLNTMGLLAKVDIKLLVAFEKYPDYMKMYSGITLDESWLIAFGFNKETYFDEDIWAIGKFSLIIFKKYFRLNFTTSSMEIKYVHQLQNLYFALTGSELVLSTVPASSQS